MYLELLLTGQLHSKDNVKVLVAGSIILDKDMASRGAVQTNISYRDPLLLQPGPHRDDNVSRTQLQCGKVPTAMDWNHLRQHLMENLHLLSVQTVEALTGFGFGLRHAAALKKGGGWTTMRVFTNSTKKCAMF